MFTTSHVCGGDSLTRTKIKSGCNGHQNLETIETDDPILIFHCKFWKTKSKLSTTPLQIQEVWDVRTGELSEFPLKFLAMSHLLYRDDGLLTKHQACLLNMPLLKNWKFLIPNPPATLEAEVCLSRVDVLLVYHPDNPKRN